MQLAPHQQRVIDEKAELDIKLKALNDFINMNPIFKTIDRNEQGRLRVQSMHMTDYSYILGERIEAFGG